MRRDDEVYPHIPQIEGLLGGIATEMGVCCSLFRPGTPALPSIGFQVDPRPSESGGRSGLVEWEFRGVKRLVWVSVGVGGCLSGGGWGSWSEWE